jgi:hypothetical protein
MKICVISDRHRRIKRVFWDGLYNVETVHRYCMQHVAENLYKEAEKSEKKENNLIDDFLRRLTNKNKPHRFVKRWRILRKLNKKTYDFLKKVDRRLENDDKEPPNFVSWAQTYDGGH